MLLDCIKPKINRKRKNSVNIYGQPSKTSFFSAYSRARRSFFSSSKTQISNQNSPAAQKSNPQLAQNPLACLSPDARSMIDLCEPSSMQDRIKYRVVLQKCHGNGRKWLKIAKNVKIYLFRPKTT